MKAMSFMGNGLENIIISFMRAYKVDGGQAGCRALKFVRNPFCTYN